MSEEKPKLSGPDLAQGVEISIIPDGTMLLGHALGEPVLLARRGDEFFGVGAICTHYGAPLEQGLFIDDTVRCPWHHACFSLRTGEALRAPALTAVSCWRVEVVRDAARQFTTVDVLYVREKMERVPPKALPATARTPRAIVIIGGGAAGNAAAEALRHEGYSSKVTMLSADESLPCDRPNLSKGYLTGAASEESNILRSVKFYKDHKIDVRLGARVAAIDTSNKLVELADGERYPYDALLLATGASPVRVDISGGDLPHVHYLRSLADSRTLVAKTLKSRQAVVIGASFIGLEVAAALRIRGIDVHVVGRETIPMEKVLGTEVGTFMRKCPGSNLVGQIG
jgi:nitrite reductase/ring-hydroxylating ferredoxin subunit